MSRILDGAMAHTLAHLARITEEQRALITAAWILSKEPVIPGIDSYLVVACFAALSFSEAERMAELAATRHPA
jgi:hypothetical protein